MPLKKKASETISPALLGLIMLAIILVVYFFMVRGTGEKATVSVNCTSKNGECRPKCEPNELQWSFDPAQFCEKQGKKCCLPPLGTTPKVTNDACAGKTVGTKCGSSSDEHYICNAQSQCVLKCDYCASNPNDKICLVQGKPVFNSNFVCGCTQAQCNEKKKLKQCIDGSVGGSPGLCYKDVYCCVI